MPVVVVESPAKAKTINKYLGPDYVVLASYGHVRDLPPKDGSVDPDGGFAMKWEVASDAKKHIRAISDALRTDDTLILATDPDREGEAISWHLKEALASTLAKGKAVSRVTFNAITKHAVTEAMKHPRKVDMELVEAYLARRALDYLVGFNLSPVLWRKLPGARSAGRVQSVCLRLIVEREMEIEAFHAREYWGVEASFATPRGATYQARLVTLDGRKLERFDIPTQADAARAVEAVLARPLTVTSVEAKPATRNPAPPFMTSTLQQEAGRKFGMGARQTMNAAQRLYEAGHITYMRTDGIDMAPEAIRATRDAIASAWGASYVPEKPRVYRNKAKNAQEAHECIRPTDLGAGPERLRLPDTDQRRLYELIWKRTIASQMASARLERTTVEIESDDGRTGLRATGQRIVFDGFLRVYVESHDDAAGDDEAVLPEIVAREPATFADAALPAQFEKATGEAGVSEAGALRMAPAAILAANRAVLALQHHTQPSPRFTEASLVKRMEELGIGRPSTYASIVSTIQERGYVRKESNRLIPEDKGRLVTIFLMTWFARYVSYDFTANLEEELDDITSGERAWKDVLDRFWRDFSAALSETSELRISEVLTKIDEVLAPHLYPARADGGNPRLCPHCGTGRLNLRTARAGGAFIGCSNYPECRYTRAIGGGAEDGETGGDRALGEDAGDTIWLKSGRFGPYVQRGEATADAPKPPRASLPKGWEPADVTLAMAVSLLDLPRLVGQHPEDGVPVEAGIGRYGPYVRHGSVYANLPDAAEVFTIGMNRAVEVLAQKAMRGPGRGRAAPAPLRELGEHPEGGPLQVMEGRYGPYVKWGKVNATLPKGLAPEAVTFEAALELVNAKAQAKPRARARTKAAPKTTAKAAKKPAAKKPAAKKTTAKATAKTAPKAAARATKRPSHEAADEGDVLADE